MSNIAILEASREAACQRCLAASKEFYEAHIDLVALDAATATLAGELPAFRIEGTPPDTLFWWVRQEEASARYGPYVSAYCPENWHTDIQARRDAYIAAASQA
jgi:hypothetical protein